MLLYFRWSIEYVSHIDTSEVWVVAWKRQFRNLLQKSERSPLEIIECELDVSYARGNLKECLCLNRAVSDSFTEGLKVEEKNFWNGGGNGPYVADIILINKNLLFGILGFMVRGCAWILTF